MLAPLLLSCEPESGTLGVYLVRSPLVAEDPLDVSLVTHLKIRVTGPGMSPKEKIFPFEPGGMSALPDIPVGQNRVVEVECLAGEQGLAISSGRTLPLTITAGYREIELFVGRVGRFSLAPGYGLSEARFGHTSVLSPTGELIMIGGASAGTHEEPQTILSSIEVFDPTSGKTTYYPCDSVDSQPCLASPRAHAAAMPLGDDVLIEGGISSTGVETTREILDVNRFVFENHSSAEMPRYFGAVITFAETSLVAGGRNATHAPTDFVVYVSKQGIVEQLSLPAARAGLAASWTGNSEKGGLGLLFGGYAPDESISAVSYLFDFNTRQFRELSSPIDARAWASAVTLADGRVLVIGGLNRDGAGSTSVDLYDPNADALCHIGELKYGRWLASAVRLRNGRVLVLGGLAGSDPGEPTRSAELLDSRFVTIASGCNEMTGTLSVSDLPGMRIARYAATATVVPNGLIVVAGGLDGDGAALNQIELFVPED